MANEMIAARRLAAAGVEMWVSVDAGYGTRKFQLQPGDVESFLADQHSWAAKQWGVTPQQLDEWIRLERAPRCGAITQKGSRCQNRLAIEVDPPVFVARHGQHCHVHDG